MAQATATAAVAIIQTYVPERCFLVLRRAAHPDDPWSGHFSFPGGRKDRSDKDIMATCIRETEEETGITLAEEHLEAILPLEPAGRTYNSPIWVQPYLFTLDGQPELLLDRSEIQGGLWLQADRFQDASKHMKQEMVPGKFFNTFPIDDYYLWGFTYRLLHAIIPPIST